MSVCVDLFKTLHQELKTLLPGITVERRYMPRVDGFDLENLRVSVYIESSEMDKIARGSVDTDTYTFGIAVQKLALPQVANDSNGDPVLDGIDNLAGGDDVIDQVEDIKSFWRAGGSLENKKLAGCTFMELQHDPVYEPIHLATYGIFSSIIDVTYQLTE